MPRIALGRSNVMSPELMKYTAQHIDSTTADTLQQTSPLVAPRSGLISARTSSAAIPAARNIGIFNWSHRLSRSLFADPHQELRPQQDAVGISIAAKRPDLLGGQQLRVAALAQERSQQLVILYILAARKQSAPLFRREVRRRER